MALVGKNSEKNNQNLMQLIRRAHGLVENPDLEKHRQSQDHIGELLGNSKEIQYRPVDIDGMDAEWVSVNRAHMKKYVILHCHGGGYSTGSSIMPQKKNPDVAELMRGKTGRVYGNLMGILTVMKGLPLAYNKDMQEDKEGLFDTVETWEKCLLVLIPMLKTMKVREADMLNAAKGGFTNATDFADYLVRQGVPFRDAHAVVGQAVAYCLDKNKALDDLSLEEFRAFSSLINDDIYEAISVYTCVAKRNTIGAPSLEQITYTLNETRKFLHAHRGEE